MNRKLKPLSDAVAEVSEHEELFNTLGFLLIAMDWDPAEENAPTAEQLEAFADCVNLLCATVVRAFRSHADAQEAVESMTEFTEVYESWKDKV